MLPCPAMDDLTRTGIFEVRRADRAECASVAQVLQQAFAEFRPLYTRAGFEATVPPASAIERRWPEGPVWVAVQEGGGVVGTVAAVVKAESASLYVRSM